MWGHTLFFFPTYPWGTVYATGPWTVPCDHARTQHSSPLVRHQMPGRKKGRQKGAAGGKAQRCVARRFDAVAQERVDGEGISCYVFPAQHCGGYVSPTTCSNKHGKAMSRPLLLSEHHNTTKNLCRLLAVSVDRLGSLCWKAFIGLFAKPSSSDFSPICL